MNRMQARPAGTGWHALVAVALGVAGLCTVVAAAYGDTSALVIGARAQGMGSAFSAVSDDATASFWNPAGLTQVRRTELNYSHWLLSDVSGVGVDFAALSVPFAVSGLAATVGLSFTRVGADLEEGPAATPQSISDSRFSVSGGLRVVRFLAVGMSLNRLEVDSERGSGAGFGFDAAVLLQPFAAYDVRVAAVGKNLSGDVKNEDLNQSWRLGLAGSLWKKRVLLSADANLRRDINRHDGVTGLYYGGVEVTPHPLFSMRGGFGSESQYGLGFGVRHRGFGFDYAYADDDEVLGSQHRFSVSLAFGPGGFGRAASAEGP